MRGHCRLGLFGNGLGDVARGDSREMVFSAGQGRSALGDESSALNRVRRDIQAVLWGPFSTERLSAMRLLEIAGATSSNIPAYPSCISCDVAYSY
jgi:hypothetical protein